MADDVDRAQTRIEQACTDGLRQVVVYLAGDGRRTCLTCAEPIEPERREALPSATRCVVSQEAHERRRRQHRSP